MNRAMASHEGAGSLKTGDAVSITCNGRAVPGSILFASSNGKSLMLEFEAIIEGHVGMMPVLLGDDGRYASIVTGIAVDLKRESP